MAVDDSGVTVAVAQTLYYLDADSGQLRWTAQLSTCSYPDMYLTGQDLHVWCWEQLWRIDRATGEIQASTRVSQNTSHEAAQFTDSQLYDVRTNWNEQYPFVRADRRYLEARNAQTYAVLWSQPLPIAGTCQHMLDQGDVFYACASQLGRLKGANGQPIWQTLVDGGEVLSSTTTGPWAFYQGDVIYAFGNQVSRFDDITGLATWQTMLRSNTLVSLMVSGDQLLVGTTTGYLHVLNANTGQLTWEQDVWASIEPRNVYMRPIGVTTQTLIIAAQNQLLSLGLDGATQWPLPTSEPRVYPTTTPTPTATRYPVFTPPPADVMPAPPEDVLAWPAAMAAFLNAAPGNDARLAALLESWQEAGQGLTNLRTADFDGDGLQEWIITLTSGYDQGWLAVIRQNQGQYELAWLDASGLPDLALSGDPLAYTGNFAVSDINDDGQNDLVYAMTSLGVCSSYSWVTPLSWNGQAFVSLDPAGLIAINDMTDLKVEAQPDSGQKQIVIEGGWSGCLSQQALLYGKTSAYRLRDGVYALDSTVPSPNRYYYFYLLEANQKLVDGDDAGVIALLEESLTSPAPANRTETEMAFAEYQLMLANVRLGNDQTAAQWAETGHYPAELYSQIKIEFWQTYK